MAGMRIFWKMKKMRKSAKKIFSNCELILIASYIFYGLIKFQLREYLYLYNFPTFSIFINK